jgi:hypothetical protein
MVEYPGKKNRTADAVEKVSQKEKSKLCGGDGRMRKENIFSPQSITLHLEKKCGFRGKCITKEDNRNDIHSAKTSSYFCTIIQKPVKLLNL